MRLHETLQHLTLHLNELLRGAAHPKAGWNEARRAFVHRFLAAMIVAGSTVISEIARRLPSATVMRHRYKAADRMLGDIDLVPVAAAQTDVLGRQLDDGWVIALDLSDIRKDYAKKMEALGRVYDGSTGEVSVPGYGLVSACAFDLAGKHKALPLPLLFEVFSASEEDFKSQNTIWLDAIDRLCDATSGATIAIDRAGDNGRILAKLLDRKRKFVVRICSGNSSRIVLFNKNSRARVRDAWKEAKMFGELEATRLSDTGKPTPYTCEYGSLRVTLPGRKDERLWLCVFDCPDHEQPLVILTNRPADEPAQVAQVLACYFARWVAEDFHRFVKQEFKLESVRTLTFRRLKNMVAMTWIAAGAIAPFGVGPTARLVLRHFEILGAQLKKPHTDGQFWGYALARGMRAQLGAAHHALRLFHWFWPAPPTRQLPIPGFT